MIESTSSTKISTVLKINLSQDRINLIGPKLRTTCRPKNREELLKNSLINWTGPEGISESVKRTESVRRGRTKSSKPRLIKKFQTSPNRTNSSRQNANN